MLPRTTMSKALFLTLLVVTALGFPGATLYADDGGTAVFLPSMQQSTAEDDTIGVAGVDRVDIIIVMQDEVERPGAVAAEIARKHGGQLGFVYQHALKGASMSVPAQAMAGIQHNPHVKFVEIDAPVYLSGQTVPTGIKRTFADENAAIGIADDPDNLSVNVDVAVIDTGVDFEHPDLNVVGGVNCVGLNWRSSTCIEGGDDDHYHGTHVAGIIGALHNDIGVVGIAPGARIWSVKVLNRRGSGYTSWIVAGIDWVTEHADTIEVANMSLGGPGYSQAEDLAIQGAVSAGVAFAVAAGNESDDASYYSPAQFDNVLTVSALSDGDGAPGGNTPPTCREGEGDDVLASFSNYGEPVDIAAPGVCILSTLPIEQGSYGMLSGTSMAAPHVAGALALLASNGRPGTDENETYSTYVDGLYRQVIAAGNDGWTDDSGDTIPEPLLDVSDSNLFDPVLMPTVGGDQNFPPTAEFTFECTDLSCTFDGSASSDSDGTIAGYSWDFGDDSSDTGLTPSHTYSSGGSYSVSLTVTDNSGDSSTVSEDVVVGEPTGDGITLTVAATKVKAENAAILSWTGVNSDNVDIYRVGPLSKDITNIKDEGTYIDSIGKKVTGTYTYKVCEAGTGVCSLEIPVTF